MGVASCCRIVASVALIAVSAALCVVGVSSNAARVFRFAAGIVAGEADPVAGLAVGVAKCGRMWPGVAGSGRELLGSWPALLLLPGLSLGLFIAVRVAFIVAGVPVNVAGDAAIVAGVAVDVAAVAGCWHVEPVLWLVGEARIREVLPGLRLA